MTAVAMETAKIYQNFNIFLSGYFLRDGWPVRDETSQG
jgi:hypothetical protein